MVSMVFQIFFCSGKWYCNTAYLHTHFHDFGGIKVWVIQTCTNFCMKFLSDWATAVAVKEIFPLLFFFAVGTVWLLYQIHQDGCPNYHVLYPHSAFFWCTTSFSTCSFQCSFSVFITSCFAFPLLADVPFKSCRHQSFDSSVLSSIFLL